MSTIKHKGNNKPQVYLAAPLFNEAEQAFNTRVTQILEELTNVYLPQRDGELMSVMITDGVPFGIAARRVFQRDMDAIRQADCIIAILDGRVIDEGVAFELGIAFSQAKKCIGLQTDSRRLAVWGNNPMITGALETVFTSIQDLVDWVRSSKLVDRTTSKNEDQIVKVNS